MANTPTTPTTPVTNSVANNIKNALFGTGSIQDKNVHVGSVLADVNNALKASPKDTNLIEAQKSLQAANAKGVAATTKTAQLANAQKLLNASLSTATKTTTPMTVAPKTTTTTTTTKTLVASPLSGLVKNSLYGAGSLTDKNVNLASISSNIDKAVALSGGEDTKMTTIQGYIKSASAAGVSATDKANYLALAQDRLKTVNQGIIDSAKQAPTTTKTTTPVQTAVPTLQSNIKNALFGTGSLTDKNVHIGSVQSDLAAALKLAPKDTNIIAAQKNIEAANAKGVTAAAKASQLAAAQKSLNTALGTTKSTKKL